MFRNSSFIQTEELSNKQHANTIIQAKNKENKHGNDGKLKEFRDYTLPKA